tara:strand:- start:1049 stop:1933 length:885 start_codon:yes stop_codon:yes gene_type:complete
MHIDSLAVLDDLTDEQAGKLFKAIKAFHVKEDMELDILTKVAVSPFISQFKRDKEKYELTCQRRAEAGAKGGKKKAEKNAKKQEKLANVANASNCYKENEQRNSANTKDIDCKDNIDILANASNCQKTEENEQNNSEFLANLADNDNKSKSKNDNKSKNDISKDILNRDVDTSHGASSTSAKRSELDNQVLEVYEHWMHKMHKNPKTTLLSPKRKRCIQARIKDGYALEDIKRAIDMCALSAFHMGSNDNKKQYNDIELICRNSEKLEFFLQEQVQVKTISELSSESDWMNEIY